MHTNPFKPTAGKTPPELIGREEALLEFTEGLDNGPGSPGRLMRITGMRGMGKTALLNRLGDIAHKRGWTVLDETAVGTFTSRMLQSLNFESVSRASIEPEFLGFKVGSIEFERSAVELRTALAKHAAKSGLLVTLDEVQDASLDETKALSVAIQHLIREDANVAFAFAGLPSMVEGVVNSDALTFLRRAVPFELGPLFNYEVIDSLEATVLASGMNISRQVASKLADATGGIPFMVQLVGYHAWQEAARKNIETIGMEEAERGIATAKRRFNETVIEPALHKLPPSQVRYLLAMSQDEGETSSTGDIALRLNKTPSETSVTRDRLIRSGLIDASAWGKVRFAIPHMREYLQEHVVQIVRELPDN